MEQIYVIMLIALGVLAIIDLMVGVSNDAVNFLNSAIGSKAISFKTTMIVASLGVLIGALFSSGMMEIARSGIFVPSMFSFNDVMIIFLAVMITDILLLDVFNSLGLPTSTTVSIIFELLGAAVCLALYKIYTTDDTIDNLGMYINTKKASTIVYSILLSVLLSFSIGSLVQYISRLIFTFHYEKKLKYFGAIFGGIAITAITFFILIKGLKGVSFISKEQFDWINEHQFMILGLNFLVFLVLSQVLISYFKVNILRVIILVGTFALALAFAGNDLVNFIGVPIAAFNSYEIFQGSGVSGDAFMMGALANDDIVAPFYFLLLAGVIMVITLWTSKKAKSVIETGVNLSRQGDGIEKFAPNTASRFIVRLGLYIGEGINFFLPKKLQIKIDRRFENVLKPTKKTDDEPAFDMVRASVNLMVASILIAIGTSLKLPLSTTYVTFMVAMGTSFADRAWDRESAVYRIAGVFKVIGGWFFTAIVAFILAFITAYILKIGEVFAFVGLLLLLGIMLYRSSRKHKEKVQSEAEIKSLRKEDIGTVKEMITESSAQISKVFRKTSALYGNLIDNLSLQDLAKLKENKKDQKKLEKEIDELKSNVFYFIKNLDDNSVEASKFYILILGYLQDMVQSIDFITTNSYSHVNNNHKQLKFNQIRDLKTVDEQLQQLLRLLEDSFKTEDFYKIDLILNDKQVLLDTVSELISKQIIRIRTTETSPKNSKLYFALLLETNDLIKSIMNLLELFKEFNKLNKE
ncbi:Phosphate transporter family protein [Flavobacterium fryxellicola]|uniref:Phosphate transporter n=1 Tax=Flavobacterium fryxellicola TaxID=249352 RepID=A0A168AHH5_9FLAO|nr:inorganic phosphate transporter [Flavobacterium fryxellicola]OAB31475.1 phosphate:sodium symporter [Flavobacterium fryxellicola]SHN53442.1 Phosphate transporter family protein [Flavobacterium fryxellicola]